MCFIERAFAFRDLGPPTMSYIKLSRRMRVARNEEWEWYANLACGVGFQGIAAERLGEALSEDASLDLEDPVVVNEACSFEDIGQSVTQRL